MWDFPRIAQEINKQQRIYALAYCHYHYSYICVYIYIYIYIYYTYIYIRTGREGDPLQQPVPDRELLPHQLGLPVLIRHTYIYLSMNVYIYIYICIYAHTTLLLHRVAQPYEPALQRVVHPSSACLLKLLSGFKTKSPSELSSLL